jgi:hypothetical protein
MRSRNSECIGEGLIVKQMTFATAKGFEVHGRATRKAEFLARMELLVPWAQFCALIEPHYPKAGNGRPPVGLERMLRMYLAGQLVGLTWAMKFARTRSTLEKHQLGAALFAKVGELLLANGMKLSGGKHPEGRQLRDRLLCRRTRQDPAHRRQVLCHYLRGRRAHAQHASRRRV